MRHETKASLIHVSFAKKAINDFLTWFEQKLCTIVWLWIKYIQDQGPFQSLLTNVILLACPTNGPHSNSIYHGIANKNESYNVATWPISSNFFRLHLLQVERNDTIIKNVSTLLIKARTLICKHDLLKFQSLLKYEVFVWHYWCAKFRYPMAIFIRNARNWGIKIAITLMVPFNARASPATAHPLTQNNSSPKYSQLYVKP